MQELHAALLALQEMDDEIAGLRGASGEFGPQLESLEAPVSACSRSWRRRARLEELRASMKRLRAQRAAEAGAAAGYHERLARVRNAREEAAVRAEIDLVRRALEADRADLKQSAEQATRTDLKVDDLQKQFEKARAEIASRGGRAAGARGGGGPSSRSCGPRRTWRVRLDPPSRACTSGCGGVAARARAADGRRRVRQLLQRAARAGADGGAARRDAAPLRGLRRDPVRAVSASAPPPRRARCTPVRRAAGSLPRRRGRRGCGGAGRRAEAAARRCAGCCCCAARDADGARRS
jgi:hypothetical protein